MQNTEFNSSPIRPINPSVDLRLIRPVNPSVDLRLINKISNRGELLEATGDSDENKFLIASSTGDLDVLADIPINPDLIQRCLLKACKWNQTPVINFLKGMQIELITEPTFFSATIYSCKSSSDYIFFDKMNPLSYCCHQGKIELVRLLVEWGDNIHLHQEEAWRCACHQGHTDLLHWLVDLGVDIHACQEDGLMWTCLRGDLMTVSWLVGLGADIHAQQELAILLAVKSGNLDLVKYLVEMGANPHVVHDNKEEENGWYTKYSPFWIEMKENYFTTLSIACKLNCVELIHYLLEIVVDPRAGEYQAVEMAAYNTDQMNLFREIEFPQPVLNILLYCSVHRGQKDLVVLWTSRGADVNAYGPMLLGTAIYYEHPDIADCLLELGYSLEQYRDRLLFDAINTNNLPIVRFLVNKGLNLNDVNCFSWPETLNMFQGMIDLGYNLEIHKNDLLAKICLHPYVDLDLVKFLLENGADVHYQNDLPLQSAKMAPECHLDNKTKLIKLLEMYAN